jgi:hypothetical protein
VFSKAGLPPPHVGGYDPDSTVAVARCALPEELVRNEAEIRIAAESDSVGSHRL